MSPQDNPSAGLEPTTPGETVGSTLRSARLRLGQDLSEVAAVLRIRPPFLQAIENGELDTLPGVPYAIGFVRTYAEHLGLDGSEMVRRFKSEAAGLERKTSLSFPSPAPEGRVPGTAALLISLVAVTVVFGGWYFYQNGGVRPSPRVPEVPERLAVPAPPANMTVGGLGDTPTESTAAAPASPAEPSAAQAGSGAPAAGATAPPPAAATPPAVPAAPGRMAAASPDSALPPPPGDQTRRLAAAPPAVPPMPGPAAPPAVEPEDSPPPDSTSLAGAPPGAADRPAGAIPPVPQVAAVPADGRVFGAQNSDSRVVIKAHGESWVQVRDATNTPLLTRVLRPGDSYRVPNQAGLTMMTGNAGVLDVFIDGAAAPALGTVGQVRRNIALDADRLRTGTTGAQ